MDLLFLAEPEEKCVDRSRVAIGKFRNITYPHHDRGFWKKFAGMEVTAQRVRESKPDGFKNGIESERNFTSE